MRALITGASGFAGRHLTQHLARATDWELWGTERPAATAPPRRTSRWPVAANSLDGPLARPAGPRNTACARCRSS